MITVRIAEFASLSGQSTADFGRVLLTHSAAASGPDFDRGFSLAPDAVFFVISLKDGEGYDLFVRDSSTGEEVRRLTMTGGSDGAHNLNPDVSADGRWVAFSGKAKAEARPDLYIVRVDGTGLRKLTDTPEVSEDRPSWSPDGAEIAYQGLVHTGTAPNWDIYVMAGSPPTSLAIKLIDAVPSANRPRGQFGDNVIAVTIPESRGPIVVSAAPDSLVPAGIDDRMKLRVTGPSGQTQEAFLYDNDACNRPLGEQWIASEVIDFEAGVSEVSVSLDNTYAPRGSNSGSPALYLIVLQAGAAPPEPPDWTSHC